MGVSQRLLQGRAHRGVSKDEAGAVFVLIHVQPTHVSALEANGFLRSKEEPCFTFIVCNSDVLLSNTPPSHPLTAFRNILKLYNVISFIFVCLKMWQPYLDPNMMCK